MKRTRTASERPIKPDVCLALIARCVALFSLTEGMLHPLRPPNHLEMVVTVEDPAIYTRPFVLSKNSYRWIPDQEAEEQVCVPSQMIQYMDIISKPASGVTEDRKSK